MHTLLLKLALKFKFLFALDSPVCNEMHQEKEINSSTQMPFVSLQSPYKINPF